METHLALSGANVLVLPVLQLSHKDRLSLPLLSSRRLL